MSNSDGILYLECYLRIQDCVTNLALFRRMLMLELRILVFEFEGTREELKSIDDECLEKHNLALNLFETQSTKMKIISYV